MRGSQKTRIVQTVMSSHMYAGARMFKNFLSCLSIGSNGSHGVSAVVYETKCKL